MSTSTLLAQAVEQIKARARHPAVERYSTLALAFCAAASVALYGLAFARPYSLFALYNRPLLDLYRISKVNPFARWELLWAFLGLGALYWLGWRAAQRTNSKAAWIIVVAGFLLFSLLLLCIFPFGAADLFDNIMHGRVLGIYNANPFYAVANQFPTDPFLPYVAWKKSPSAYGPGWELLAGLTARLAGNGIVINILAFKLLAGIFLLASTVVVAAILRAVAPERALAGVVLLAWNPVILYETFGNGHNDIAMIFWVLLAAWLLLKRAYTAACVALVMGALFKFIPLLMLPAAGLIALRDLPDWRARLRFVLVTGAVTLALVGLAYFPFWQDVNALTINRRMQMFTKSLPAVILYTWVVPQIGLPWGSAWVSTVAAWLTVLFSLGQGFFAWRNRSWLSFTQAAFNILMFYLLVTCLWFQSWYALWPLGLAAILPPGHAARLAALFGYAVTVTPFVFDPSLLWIKPLPPKAWRELRLAPTALIIPWLYTLFALWDVQRKRNNQKA